MTRPASVNAMPRLPKEINISLEVSPNAMRTPISLVRCVTAYLGPGIPDPAHSIVPANGHRHRLPEGYRIRSKPVVGGFHHEYSLETLDFKEGQYAFARATPEQKSELLKDILAFANAYA